MRAPVHQLHRECERSLGPEAHYTGIEGDKSDRVPRHDGAVDIQLVIVVAKQVACDFLAIGINHDGLQFLKVRCIVPFPGAVVIEICGIGTFGRNCGHLEPASVSGSDDSATSLHEAASGTAATQGQRSAGKSLLSQSLSHHAAVRAVLRPQHRRTNQGRPNEAHGSIHSCPIKPHWPDRLPKPPGL